MNNSNSGGLTSLTSDRCNARQQLVGSFIELTRDRVKSTFVRAISEKCPIFLPPFSCQRIAQIALVCQARFAGIG